MGRWGSWCQTCRVPESGKKGQPLSTALGVKSERTRASVKWSQGCRVTWLQVPRRAAHQAREGTRRGEGQPIMGSEPGEEKDGAGSVPEPKELFKGFLSHEGLCPAGPMWGAIHV